MNYLPVALKIKNKKAIVVGGGKVGQRKIEALLLAEARITLIAPKVTVELRELAKQGAIEWLERKAKESDIFGATLVISATDDSFLNEQVSNWAKVKGISVNVVDKPLLSDFISPAVLRTEKALIAVYTDGKDPVLSRDLKNYLKEKWDEFLLYRNRL
ncbi:MAG: bifunctional precorrin-2 dehydrogenase/sirohydrochlorin ferrochelatase [Candidatus Omnitrophica bacterium]|nr:bifunctional precorrin-2 dehydrogenase/sirohydrochlorin ferrochelatase [Candidatus Omnitrophota bacterium]